MRIPDEIIRQLHEINCEDAAKRFGLDVKKHMAHCFKHNDRIASLGFRNNHWKCFSCDIGGDAIIRSAVFLLKVSQIKLICPVF